MGQYFNCTRGVRYAPPWFGNGANSNGPVTFSQRPFRPSNAFPGPLIPSAASKAANNPFRAAYAVATFFHGVSSPERVTRRGRLEVAAMPMAWAVAWMESFKRLETPAAVATPIAYPWSHPLYRKPVASLRRAKISYTTIMLVRNSFPSTFIAPAKAKSAPRQSLGCPPG